MLAVVSDLFSVAEYAQVTKMLGNGHLEAMCFDGVKRLCHIRGKLRKKVSCKCMFGLCGLYTDNTVNNLGVENRHGYTRTFTVL